MGCTWGCSDTMNNIFGTYFYKVIDENDSIVSSGTLNNVITDGILDVDSLADTLVLALGTGGTTPTSSDTDLESLLTQKNVTTTGTVLEEESSQLYLIRFWTTSFTNISGDIKELGLFDTGKTSMISHVNVVDGSGAKTIIRMTTNLTLEVTYRIAFPVSSVTASGIATSDFGDVAYSVVYPAISDESPYEVNGFFSGDFRKIFHGTSYIRVYESGGTYLAEATCTNSYDIPTRTLTVEVTIPAVTSGDRTIVKLYDSNNNPYILLDNLYLESDASCTLTFNFTWNK